jgi:hypothetical protein
MTRLLASRWPSRWPRHGAARPRNQISRLVACALLAISFWAVQPALPAHADYRDLIMDACRQDERVDGTYSQKDYREALQNLSDDQLQYTDCEAIIRAAQLAAARAESGGNSPGGIDSLISGAGGDPLATATPAERAAVNRAVKQAEAGGGEPVRVGGAVVDPSSLGAGRAVASSASDLPTPLLIALAIAAIAALAALASAIATRVRDARQR